MLLRYFFQIFDGDISWVQMAIYIAIFAFMAWMFIDALRRGEYVWAVFMFIFPLLNAVLYYFMVYRPSGGSNPLAGFKLPGAGDRREIKRLKTEIHHLDRAHHHMELGDIYFNQGRFAQAEECYRAAFGRDDRDEDIRAHLGNCLTKRGNAKEALPLLEGVCAQNPKHDYGYTLMSLAEAEAASGLTSRAEATFRRVLSMYSYARARVQLAELLLAKKETAEARKILQEVIDDEPHTANFQRKREAPWTRKARGLLRQAAPSS